MTTPIESRITSVTVYPDRARISRSGKTSLEPGAHRLLMTGLPLTLLPESVRVSGKGTARARLGGVELRREFYTETPSASAAELEQRIQQIDDQEIVLADEGATLEATLTFLNGLANQGESYGRGLAYGKFGVPESAELLAFLTERSAAAQARRRAIALEKRELAKQKAKLQRELDQIRSARPRERYAAVVDVQALTGGDLELELVYVVNNAGWKPLYDLRLDEGDQERAAEVELSYLAQVTQRSGEDWTAVQLVLSTARPALSATLPELEPWYVRVYSPPVKPARAPAPRGLMKTATFGEPEAMAGAVLDEAPAAEPATVAMEVDQAEVSQEGAAVIFTVPQAVDVPSDGSPHKTSVASLSLAPELDFLSAPKIVPAAYRRARITNSTNLVLLPGAANIFFGSEFVGTTQLEHVAPNESFTVYLGADDRIKVERELIAREVDKKLLGDRRRLRYAYQIKLQNLRPGAEQIVLQDQLPVSTHEAIKVRADEIQPPPAKQSSMGILEWRQTLEAGQEITLVFGFSVEHPRDMTITGLPEAY
ncbi:MAG: mucoidy inhibitor MuiA family protein [Chloroflexota bacterium]